MGSSKRSVLRSSNQKSEIRVPASFDCIQRGKSSIGSKLGNDISNLRRCFWHPITATKWQFRFVSSYSSSAFWQAQLFWNCYSCRVLRILPWSKGKNIKPDSATGKCCKYWESAAVDRRRPRRPRPQKLNSSSAQKEQQQQQREGAGKKTLAAEAAASSGQQRKASAVA